jgi:hypothetical protein
MPNLQSVSIDVIRSLAFSGISGTYAPLGSSFAHRVRLICITNNTDGDMFFSDDGVNNKLFVAASSFKLFDCTTNTLNTQKEWLFPIGTQFYVVQSTVATKGAVYLECLWGQ